LLGALVGDIQAIIAWERSWRDEPVVVCHWCETILEPKDCHADHVIPLSKGGAHDLGNLVVSCATCNCLKGAKMPDEWLPEVEKVRRIA
jgi:5-methylcytosine-specific restriction endonuclease McrA